MNQILVNLSAMMRQGGALLPLIALAGGFLTSLTPCSLSSLPFVIAYIGGGEDQSRKRNFILSATYAVGNAITFGALGLLASFLGTLLNFTGKWWYLLLGILMLLVALEQFGLLNFSKKFNKLGQKVKRNRFGAFTFGVISGFFASPCATPVMIALMTMITTSQLSLLLGIGLYLLFAVGNAITIITVGMLSGKVSVLRSESYSKFSKFIEILFGSIIFIFGLFLIYQAL